MDTVARTIRSIEIDAASASRAANAIEDLYNDTLDVVVAREAFPRGDVTAYDTTLGWRLCNPKMQALGHTDPLGETAEKVAEKFHVHREAQDAFALESQRRAAQAQQDCVFSDEIVPVSLPDGSQFTKDEYPSFDGRVTYAAGFFGGSSFLALGITQGLPVSSDHRFFMSFTLAGLGNFSPFNGAMSGMTR